ncbi:hypothetical protein [Methylobacterium sp. Leaf125]|uniref:hypothetical protein n=1 Tax=Methylobacterium sp. Leaf125 TaxID=1736265 RepID=UPI000A6B2D0F|nr:hypothetical protein [Methylobacterium sp. Leaf125]
MNNLPDSFKGFFDNYLLEEWALSAANSARNLGFEHMLGALSSEHWQMVLTSVAARMQMRGALPPLGWKAALAQHVGRQAD